MKNIINQYGNVEDTLPESSNSSNPITNYQDRKALDEFLSEEDSFTVDIRTQKFLYGRVDSDNNAIYPNTNAIKFDPVTKIFGFDFVTTLIRHFITEWLSISAQEVKNTSIYKEVRPSNKNFRSVKDAFQEFYHSLFEEYRANLFFSGKEITILDFDGYVVDFANYLKSSNIPFTREALIRSNYYHPDNSLLIYNLQEELHGNDEQTYTRYYKDPMFYFFSEVLLHHGLVLDRHSPWRFVVNINSPQVKTPAEEREFKGQSIHAVFENYFVRAYKTETEFIKKSLVDNYNEFVNLAHQKAVAQCGDTSKPIQYLIKRSRPQDDVATNLTVLNFLIAARENETKKVLGTPHKATVLRELQKDPEKNLQVAYEKLHQLMKIKQFRQVSTVLNRPDALSLANHVGCNGAHQDEQVGWLPCKDRGEFLLKAKEAGNKKPQLANLLDKVRS